MRASRSFATDRGLVAPRLTKREGEHEVARREVKREKRLRKAGPITRRTTKDTTTQRTAAAAAGISLGSSSPERERRIACEQDNRVQRTTFSASSAWSCGQTEKKGKQKRTSVHLVCVAGVISTRRINHAHISFLSSSLSVALKSSRGHRPVESKSGKKIESWLRLGQFAQKMVVLLAEGSRQVNIFGLFGRTSSYRP